MVIKVTIQEAIQEGIRKWEEFKRGDLEMNEINEILDSYEWNVDCNDGASYKEIGAKDIQEIKSAAFRLQAKADRRNKIIDDVFKIINGEAYAKTWDNEPTMAQLEAMFNVNKQLDEYIGDPDNKDSYYLFKLRDIEKVMDYVNYQLKLGVWSDDDENN